MSTIASLTGHRPKNQSLMLNNFTSLNNMPSYFSGPGNRNGERLNTMGHSSLSPSHKSMRQKNKEKEASMGSTSLLNTSSLIHYGKLYDNLDNQSININKKSRPSMSTMFP